MTLVAFLIGVITGWLSIITISLTMAASKADRFQEKLAAESDQRDAEQALMARLEQEMRRWREEGNA